MERIVKKSTGFREAERWDVEQQVSMTPRERQAAARALRLRIYPHAKDVRECHRSGDDPGTSTTCNS